METQDVTTMANENAEEQPMPQAPKKKNRGLIVTIVVLVVLLAAGAVAFYLFHRSNAEERETAAYQSLENDYNQADYEAFLSEYPESEYAEEVSERLKQLQNMAQAWSTVALSGRQSDFVDFKNRFRDAYYDRLCDGKIDSLDWVDAQQLNTQQAYQTYIEMHPDGRYASEAAIAQSTTQDLTVSETEREAITQIISGFFDAFSRNDETAICSYIPPVMGTFLSKQNATKADVVSTISRMFTENILSCTFTVNNDYQIVKVPGSNGAFGYKVTFSVDQRIERNDEGKTFGSYKATAEVDDQLKLTALTMTEVSRIDNRTAENN